ncbi:ethanolamine utilization protein EutJ [Clostridium botulinum]|uniref:ethanolamine utilization protein EutJ n=1 Tax=Clostridium sp. ZBS20 TaxID=2949966 RepID=UPI00207A72EB|nr:ethanolamine utilization protein EutJ [Clostridium sp. ZBS20]MBN1052097.1 ethanolamine utilization protein EutJ [Clostridium botulinum]
MELNDANKGLDIFYDLIKEEKCNKVSDNLKVGVDLGTANIVLSVVDENNNPVAGASYPASVVKDGLVVDFIGAIEIVKKLKAKVEKVLGTTISYGSTAIPPGTLEGNVKAIGNVLEAADIELVSIIDEPTAAAAVLGIKDGAVVDVGGGTTGVSILKDGKVLYTADEPTGGTHMSLVLSGNYNISFEEAEKLKKDPKKEKDNFILIKPVIEKMSYIVKKHLQGYDVNKIYVVGGACSFSGFTAVFEKIIGIETIKPNHPLLVTPLGIAVSCIK